MNWLRRIICRLFGLWCPKPGIVTDITVEIDYGTSDTELEPTGLS
jgi:hypothetical protein